MPYKKAFLAPYHEVYERKKEVDSMAEEKKVDFWRWMWGAASGANGQNLELPSRRNKRCGEDDEHVVRRLVNREG